MLSHGDVHISLEQAQAIIDRNLPSSPPLTIVSCSKLQNTSLSSITATQSFVATTADGTSYLLKAASLPPSDPPTYTPNTLEFEYSLAQKLSKLGDVPQPKLIAFDPSQSIIPYPYLLSSKPTGITLSVAKASKKLTDRQELLLDLRLGTLFRRVHDEVQNDWFGLASQEKDEMYNWQEAFTYLVESVLFDARQLGEELPYDDIGRYLSRAIGFFLFDDCEVPSLVSFFGDADSITVDFNPESSPQDGEIPITSILPLSHALWGDPLMEAMFVDPSKAFVEGYGGSPIVFSRQVTKQMWYTLFRALVILVQSHTLESGEEKRQWARGVVLQRVRDLEKAPCY
ncbi:hypothetical protein BXZ70DRAFT_694338 [Cristinia sonorae]|uniref:Aminoglycoside phosphotransferase domain-containing protein n=1 Tax=Cristinia sonorae TaxID=1940300 RepID=A0A8K0UDF7_9AGAR|nr:hypothetical protein BXZ70DRAFT_694338 [Cristinia sonorae]